MLNYKDLIAEDLETHSAFFCPIILGSDKTTVSVATGHNEYWPVYLSIRNLHNNIWQAHHNGLVLLGFLAILKSKFFLEFQFFISIELLLADHKHQNDADFRKFCCQLLHSALEKILEALKPFMMEAEVVCYPDGHFQRVIYGLGPYIADYPEQALLSCIVQGWCPR